MRHKILTVDDSKTVRIIVRKAFKGFDCDILEAANGVEGLALAAKELPDLILLDVTMPVMDGVEMLTKLKADPLLKMIPVMMLTAEGGREHVLKIAKIGVRDYIVKPFKEDVLVDKTGRIIDLKPMTEGPARVRTVLDALELLVVEDKPVIVQQIQEGLKHLPWIVQGSGSIAEAQLACGRKTPDLLLISLSLPEEGAFNFLRLLRNAPKTKYTPAFGLVVKTELGIQAQAQQVGFSAIITKPIDMADLESKASKAMNLDTSMRYFRTDGEYLVMTVPENCSESGFIEAGGYLKAKLSEAVDAGQNKAIFDLQAMRSLQMGLIKLLMQAFHTARELGIQHAVVGNAQLTTECKGFEDTKGWTFHPSAEEAKAAMGKELVGA
jgi:two-component system cell cycle response regulator